MLVHINAQDVGVAFKPLRAVEDGEGLVMVALFFDPVFQAQPAPVRHTFA